MFQIKKRFFKIVIFFLILLQYGLCSAVPAVFAATNIGANVNTDGTFTINLGGGFTYTPGAGAGLVLKSDAAGVATWSAESDPTFTASEANLLVVGDKANLDSAIQPGDNVSTLTNDSGYLNSETDPAAGAINGIIKSNGAGIFSALTDNSANWDAAFTHITTDVIETAGDVNGAETDPVFVLSPANGIVGGDITNWNNAFSWGDHSLAGYLTVETDPVFTTTSFTGDVTGLYNATAVGDDSHNHTSSTISGLGTGDFTSANISQWTNNSGYLTTESDPLSVPKTAYTANGDILLGTGAGTYSALTVGTNGQILTVSGGVPTWQNAASGFADPMTTRGDIIYRDATNTTTRLGRGTSGQVLKSDGTDIGWAAEAAETDPVYSGSSWFTTTNNSANWDAAFTHITTDVIETAADVNGAEIDPVFGASAASGIAAGDITNWNNAFGWGDHSLEGYLTSETDPVAGAINGIVKSNGAGVFSAVTDNSSNWNTAFGWGNHSGLYTPVAHKTTEDALNGLVKVNGAGVYSAVTDNSANWDAAFAHVATDVIETAGDVNGAETDPVFGASAAAGILAGDITNWDAAFTHVTTDVIETAGDVNGVETDPVFTTTSFSGDVTGLYNATAVGDDSHDHTSSTISGLGTGDFTSANISQWTNNSGYLTSESDPLAVLKSTFAAAGDLLTGTGAGTYSALTVGSTDQLLSVSGGAPSWQDPKIKTVYSGATAKTNVIIWNGSGSTSNGSITFYPTSDGTSGGTALFTNIYSIQTTGSYNTTTSTDYPFTAVRSISGDKKTLIVNVGTGTGMLLGGDSIVNNGNSITVYATIIGD